MFGHTELVIGGAIAGEFRVTRVEAPESIGPRLALSLECVLHDVHAEGLSEEPIEAYRLIGLIGELSLTRGENPVAVLHWLGAGHWARSANYLQPVSLDLVADIDPARVERLASFAGDKGLQVWLKLWPTFMKADLELRASVGLMSVEIPTAKWAELASRWRGFTHEVVLLTYSIAYAEQFRSALVHARRAQDLVDEARYPEAVQACRKALERLASETQEQTGGEGVHIGLRSLVGPKKAQAYAGFLTKLKEVGNLAVHGSSEAHFSRSEAVFMVRSTLNLLGLYGSIVSSS